MIFCVCARDMHASELENSNSHISWNYRQHLNSKVLNCRSHTIHVFSSLCRHRLCGTKNNQSTHIWIDKNVDEVKRNSNKHMLKDMAHETKPHRKLNNNKSVTESTSIEFMQRNENETKQHTNSQSQLKISIKPFAQFVCMSVCFANRRRRRRCCCYCRYAFAQCTYTSKDTNESAYNLRTVLFYVIDITSDDSFNLLFSLSFLCIFPLCIGSFFASLLALNILHGCNLFGATQLRTHILCSDAEDFVYSSVQLFLYVLSACYSTFFHCFPSVASSLFVLLLLIVLLLTSFVCKMSEIIKLLL